MKKLLLSLLISLGVVFAAPLSTASVFAAQPNRTEVSGEVQIDGHTVAGARVYAVCNDGSANTTNTVRSNNNGTFSVHFKKNQCLGNQSVTVVVKKGGKAGQKTVNTVNGAANNVVVNVTTTAVPEFGTIAGVASAAIVGGGLLVMRKRYVGQEI